MTDPHRAIAKERRAKVRRGDTDAPFEPAGTDDADDAWMRQVTRGGERRHTTSVQWVEADDGKGHALRPYCNTCHKFVAPAVPERDIDIANELARAHEAEMAGAAQ